MNRKQYWNDTYKKYWQERTADTDGRVARGDCIPADVSLFERYADRLSLKLGDRVLDVGVGFGRLIPPLLQRGASVYGVDISPQMIEEALKVWGSQVAELRETEAEALPYQEMTFDHVICWGVFDACHQGEALAEMARVLKPGGRLLLSGKNDDYRDDDELAYVAEINARAKGHPNFFTNVAKLLDAVSTLGMRAEQTYYFQRRGDFGAHRFTHVAPPQFYEYALICIKERHVASSPGFTVARSFSLTCARREPQVVTREADQ